MAVSNHERVGKTLDLLKAGLRPYFEREMRAAHGEKWIDEAASTFRDGKLHRDVKSDVNWDNQALLSVMANSWTLVFGKKLGKAERNIVEELRGVRNDWAHEKSFSTDDTYRAIDSAERLLRAVGAASEAQSVERLRLEVLAELSSARQNIEAKSPSVEGAPRRARAAATQPSSRSPAR